jgi:hypothetical protein
MANDAAELRSATRRKERRVDAAKVVTVCGRTGMAVAPIMAEFH